MTIDIRSRYDAFVAICNARDFSQLPDFVSPDFTVNSHAVGLENFTKFLTNLVVQIPDLKYDPLMVVSDNAARTLAVRFVFECTPSGEYMGLPINGRKVSWEEHIFYKFDEEGERIKDCFLVYDKGAVERQLKEYEEKGIVGEGGEKKEE